MMSPADAASLPAPAENSRWADARRLTLIAFGYAITLKLALFFPDTEGILAAVWPPGGVALAALLLSPRRQRRAILATIFVTGNVINLLSGRPALASAGFMVANVLESWGGAWLFAWWCGERRVTFARVDEVTALAACALLVNSVSSLIGAVAAQLATNAPFHEVYVTWWISDGMGILLVTPLVVGCAQPWRRITARHWLRQLEAMALGVVWCVFAWIGFLGATTELPVVPRPYWIFVPLVWVGLRFGTRVTTTLLTVLAAIAVWITVMGRGEFPLGGANPVEHLQMVQLFLGVVVLTGLTLAAVVAERKATEAALKLSEGKYRLLIENQSDLVIQFDPANRIQFVSPTYCATFGKSEAELVGASFFPLVHEEDRARVEASLQRVLAPPYATQHEERNLTVAGWRWFAWSAKAALSPDGQVTSIIGVGRDISERKQAEDARQASESRYRRLVKGAPDIIYVFSSKRGGLYYSPRVEAVLAYSPEYLLEHPFLWQSLIDPAALDGIGLAIQKFATGEPFDLEYRIKDSAGRWHWLRDRSIGRQQVGDDLIIEGIATDITAQKQAQEALQHHRVMLTRTEKIALIGSWEWEVATGTVTWSEELFRIFQRDQAKGAPSFAEQEELYHPEDMAQLKGAVVTAVNEGRAYELELRAIRADGETRVCLARGHAEMGAGGRAARLFGSLQDITERKKVEAALQSALREKESLLKEVHHRVKNNLQVISSLLRLEEGRSEHPTTKSVLQEMQGRVLSMAQLHDLLYRSGTFAAVDLGGYLKQLTPRAFRAQIVRPGAVRLQLDLASVQVEMDQALPCGLLVNELISNCLKHGFPGDRTGEVHIALQPVAGGPQVRQRVSDTGVGLPADFEAKRGKSLGLQLVFGLARQLHGQLTIGPGPGAVFDVTFTPRHSKPNASIPPP